MLESVLALALFGIVILIFGATFPAMMKGSGASASYAQAVLLAQHKIDQLRQLGFAQLQDATVLKTMGIIDSTLNADGSYSFTQVDGLSDTSGGAKGYFGMTSSGTPNGTGKIVISQALTGQGANAPSTLKALQVTVTVAWTGSGQHDGSCTLHTVIAAQ